LVGGHNTKSKLAYDKIIHSLSQSDYVGYTSSPCDFVNAISLFIDLGPGGQQSPVMAEYDWAIAGPENDAAFGSTVSDPSLAQITNNGAGDMLTLTLPDDGLVHEFTINPPSPTQTVTFCDACSAGDVVVQPASFTGMKLQFITDTCTINPANQLPTIVASWGNKFGGSCVLNDNTPVGVLPLGGTCESNGAKNCYDTSTPTCRTRYCPGDTRIANSDCTGFADLFPIILIKVPAGCQ